MRPNSPLLASLLGSASGAALAVKDQRFFVVTGPSRGAAITVGEQKAYAIVNHGASGLLISGNGAHVGVGNQGSLTSIDVPLPSTAENGDTFVMHIMHRDTLTTPAGWTLQATSAITGSLQYISVLTRVKDGSEGSTVTVTQASANRMLGQCVSVEGSIASITTTTGVDGSGGTGAMTCGAISITNGIALIGFSWLATTQYYNGARGFALPYSQVMGTQFYEECRLGIGLYGGLPGANYPSGLVGRHVNKDMSTYSVTTAYNWSVTVIEAA